MARTYLFVPAHETRRVAKALATGSEAVILDLEDAVPGCKKEAARRGAADFLAHGNFPKSVEIWVRVNDFQEPYFDLDVREVNWHHASGAVIPKAEDPASVAALDAAGVSRILLVIESVAGFDALPHLIARSGRIERIAIGTWDLALDLGLVDLDDPDDSELIWQLRGKAMVESRRLGLRPPIDGIYAQFQNDEGLRQVCQRALRMGFGGKLLIHPRQVPIAQSVFVPDPTALEFAREAVTAYEKALRQGRGAAQVRGQMVDRPVVERARALLAHYGDPGL